MRLIVALLFAAVFSKCAAQGYSEGVNLSYDFLPLKINATAGTETFTGNNFKLTDAVPIYIKKDKSQYLVFGLNLESMDFSGSHPDLPVTGFYGISPLLGYCRQVNQKLALSAILIPLLNSDLYIVNSSDFHFGGVVRGVYRLKENFAIRVTLGYRQQFYGTQYIVFLGLDWKIGNRWRAFCDLPNNATLFYSLRPKINAGVNYLSGGYTSFHLTEQQHYILYNYANAGLFLEYYLSPTLAVRGTVAYSVLRNLDLYNMNQKVTAGVLDYIPLSANPIPLNTEVSNGLAFKLSLSLRFPELKNK